MYINKSVNLTRIIADSRRQLLLLLVVVTATTTLYLEVLLPYLSVAPAMVSALGAAISLFIAFFTAQAYDRWWEARKIWGTFVNDSRSFGRMVMTLFGKPDGERGVTALQDRLVRRHIAYLYAVKEHLRRETDRGYLAYLSAEDGDRIRELRHPANGLLHLQGEDIDKAERDGLLDVIRMAQFNDMLSRFSTSMGMAERIKTTVFPPYYASMIRVAIWALVVEFPLALSDDAGYRAIVYSFLVGSILLLVFRMAEALLNPFEGKPADTPMSSIIRTIEINLLEQVGEKDIPAPLEPIDGRYLL